MGRMHLSFPFHCSILPTTLPLYHSTTLPLPTDSHKMSSSSSSSSGSIYGILAPILGTLCAVGLAWLFAPALRVAARTPSTEELPVTVTDSAGTDHSDGNDTTTTTTTTIVLSLIIPAYDEEARISTMLQEAYDFLTDTEKGPELLQQLQDCIDPGQTQNPAVEWIVVNDGSKDQTVDVVVSFFQKQQPKQQQQQHSWRVVSLTTNSGKGAAVQTGMRHAQGSFRLMVDADGATEFGPGLERTVAAMTQHLQESDYHYPSTSKSTSKSTATATSKALPHIAVFGSRAHLQQQATQQRSWIRSLLMYGFHFCVNILISSSHNIQDTQCGFKLFTNTAAQIIFNTLHLRRWAFDIEVS